MAPRAGVASRRRWGDGGQVLPLLALVILVGMAAALAMARLGVEVIDRARARTAADAAALAGVDGGRSAADAAARANGGRVVHFVTSGGATEVEVRVGDSEATSRARPGAPRAEAKWINPAGPTTVPSAPSGAIAQSVRAHP
jgi:hypothetical protein